MLFWLLQLVSYMLYCDERNVYSSSVDGWNIEWRCKNSLWSVCKVQDHIVVPEFSTLVLYWLLRNWHFFATLSSEIAWSWRWQCKVLNIGVKNDVFAVCVCVIYYSPLFPDPVDFDPVSPKHWDEAARWYDVTVTCLVLSVLSLNFVCVAECGGKMHLREGEFEKAHTDFFEAFKNYDESGSPRRTTCLKYLVLANMWVSMFH